MVYYHTSKNVIGLRNILLEYSTTNEKSPDEFMKFHIEQCPEEIDDSKLSWFVETFLGIQKHKKMLDEITAHVYEGDGDEKRDYLSILLYSIIFQLTPKHTKNLYKCLFNLSKSVLRNLIKLTSSKDMVMFISEIAQKYYDTKYVTEKIIKPLLNWEPQIAAMAHEYQDYLQKQEQRKTKPPTVPIQPMLLSRKSNKAAAMPAPTPETPSIPEQLKVKRMLTKNSIDKRLDQIREKNRQKAENLLTEALNYSQPNTKFRNSAYGDRNSFSKEASVAQFVARKPNLRHVLETPVQVKETAATVKRIAKTVQRSEEEEIEWLDMLIHSSKNITKVDELIKMDRIEKERERIFDIERKHLLGQISFEEAMIAKRKLAADNKKKYEMFLKEKARWNLEIDYLKQEQLEQNRKQVEKLTMLELSLLEAKNNLALKRKQDGEKARKEKEELLDRVMKHKQNELERKMNMIKEIKIIAMISKVARIPRAIDLTETSGCRLLCEMSLAELEERLLGMRLALNDELERKKNTILRERESAKQALNDARNNYDKYFKERAQTRKAQRKGNALMGMPPSKEIGELKKLLVKKRKERIKMSSSME